MPTTITNAVTLQSDTNLFEVGADTRIAAGIVAVAPLTLDNFGTIDNGLAPGVASISMSQGGSVTNAGLMSSSNAGVLHFGTTGVASLLNQGTLQGAQGIELGNGGQVFNLNNAVISASSGPAVLADAPANVTNWGTISGQSGINLVAGGNVFNSGTIQATEFQGIAAATGRTTILNAGLVSGSNGTVRNGILLHSGPSRSVSLASGYDNLLKLYTGAAFQGIVDGGNDASSTATSTILLATNSHGTLAGLGTSFTGFNSITIDQGATWELTGSITAAVSVVSTATIRNQGTLLGRGSAASVSLNSGNYLLNGTNGVIGAAAQTGWGIDARGFTQTIVNAGVVQSGSVGVFITNGSFTNQSGGRVSGAVWASGMHGQMTNQSGATMSGNVAISGGLTNQGRSDGRVTGYGSIASILNTGTISGGITVSTANPSTIDNAGVINTIAGSKYAISFGTLGNSTLIVHGGASIQGSVDGGNNSTLRLTSGSGSISSITNFSSVNIDANGSWTVGITNPLRTTVNGFNSDDTIQLVGFNDVNNLSLSGHKLIIARTAHASTYVNLDPVLDYSHSNFVLSTNTAGDAVITTDLACFAQGTGIETEKGRVTVEALSAGTMVLTANGTYRPVRWIGFRHVDLASHPEPDLVQPIRVKAHAIGHCMPDRDVLLSPEHALLVNGALIPVHLLVNHASITRETHRTEITYYHVELDKHDVLLADGLPAESYRDTGNRGFFENAQRNLRSHPHAATFGHPESACAQVLHSPDEVEPVWKAIVTRAQALGFTAAPPAVTNDSAIRLQLDDAELRPVASGAGRFIFAVPARPGHVHISSRSARPSGARPWWNDRRRLGVAVQKIRVSHDGEQTDIAMDHPALTQGWWQLETADGRMWRWTNGRALLPLPPGPACIVEIHTGAALDYPL